MTDLEKAARMALSTLEGWAGHGTWVWPESALQQAKRNTTEAITALRQALEQPAQQEHKPWCASLSSLMFKAKRPCDCVRVPLPTAPSSAARSADSAAPFCKQWVSLTDEAIWLEYQTLWPFHPTEEPRLAADIAKFARAIEAKLKEENT